jgi:hypothetical protein
VGRLVFAFVTNEAPSCIQRLNEVVYEFVKPQAQEDWIYAIRQSPEYASAREDKIAELRLKLPHALLDDIEERLVHYDKARSHELRDKAEALGPKLRSDYATLVALRALTLKRPISTGQQRTLYRETWLDAGLRGNLLRVHSTCPNCQEQADLYLAEQIFEWELACAECGYEDRAAPEFPWPSSGYAPEVDDHTWASWACCTSAIFGDWHVSKRRRVRFMDNLRAFVAGVESALAADLISLAHDINDTPLSSRRYSFSARAGAVLLARARGEPTYGQACYIQDRDADRLAFLQRARGHLQLLPASPLQPYGHWHDRYTDRIKALTAALENDDALSACVNAGQLLLEGSYYGFVLPLEFSVELEKTEAVELSNHATSPEHLAAFLTQRLKGVKIQQIEQRQVEQWLREYAGVSQTDGSDNAG